MAGRPVAALSELVSNSASAAATFSHRLMSRTCSACEKSATSSLAESKPFGRRQPSQASRSHASDAAGNAVARRKLLPLALEQRDKGLTHVAEANDAQVIGADSGALRGEVALPTILNTLLWLLKSGRLPAAGISAAFSYLLCARAHPFWWVWSRNHAAWRKPLCGFPLVRYNLELS